ncbi:MAG: helix-turn-helix domain-containing protein [Candidatus Hodarchaeota archaeon]
METVRIVTGEEETAAVIRALNDENRRRILHALRSRRMSTSEICDFLSVELPDKTMKPQTVRYHLKELERAELITQDGYEPAGNGDSHIMTKLWRATAENVFIATTDMGTQPVKTVNGLEKTIDLGGTMRTLGFVIDDEEEMQQLAKDFEERDRLWQKGRSQVKKVLNGATALDPGVYTRFRRILSVVRLSESDYKRYQELTDSITERLRKAYREGLGRNPEVY